MAGYDRVVLVDAGFAIAANAVTAFYLVGFAFGCSKSEEFM